jgi:hypothetical protein
MSIENLFLGRKLFSVSYLHLKGLTLYIFLVRPLFKKNYRETNENSRKCPKSETTDQQTNS